MDRFFVDAFRVHPDFEPMPRPELLNERSIAQGEHNDPAIYHQRADLGKP
jgi:hypothetical protein